MGGPEPAGGSVGAAPDDKPSAEQALSRQSDSLDRHEATIAHHTVIQSWTNIISVVTSIVMTAALVVIATLQWQSSERAVNLQYAQAMPQYKLDVTYADGRKFGLSSAAIWADEAPTAPQAVPTKTISVSQTSGTSILDYLEFRQIYGVRDEKTESFCEFLLRNAFSTEDGKTYVDQLSARVPAVRSMPAAKGGNPVQVSWRRTEILTRYMDVFGKTKYDLIVVGEAGSYTKRDVGDPVGMSEFAAYALQGKMFLVDTHGPPPPECGPSVMAPDDKLYSSTSASKATAGK